MQRRTDLEKYHDRFDDLRTERRIFTRDQIDAAYHSGEDAESLAIRNDNLAVEDEAH